MRTILQQVLVLNGDVVVLNGDVVVLNGDVGSNATWLRRRGGAG
jgi:hypothetical protein